MTSSGSGNGTNDGRSSTKPDKVVYLSNSSIQSASDQAMEWVARLRADNVSLQDKADFAQWLDASQTHKNAFDEALELWQMLAFTRSNTTQQGTSSYYRHVNKPWWPLAAAATVLLTCLVMVLQMQYLHFSTQKGQVSAVMLPDGSTATLNTNSKIRVRYIDGARQVELLQGEALFDVKSNPKQPFTVLTQQALTTVLGTTFGVKQNYKTTDIKVLEGKVQVEYNQSSEDYSARGVHLLEPGQQSNVAVFEHKIGSHDANVDFAWQHGQLVYRDLSLNDILMDLNRYVPTVMAVSDENLAQTKFSAVLKLDDQQAMLDALKKVLPIRWKQVSDHLIIITPS